MSNDSHRVRGRNECTLAVDHVSITVTVASCTKLDVILLNGLDEGVSICQVGIRMTSTEIGKGNAILDGILAKTESVNKNSASIRTGNTVETIEKDSEVVLVLLEEGFDEREIENLFQEDDIIRNRVDDDDFRRTEAGFANFSKIDLKYGRQKLIGGSNDIVY